MKHTLFFTALAFALQIMHSAKAQNRMEMKGKKYIALTGESCKDIIGGGCTVYQYSVLEFNADSVDVYVYQNASCTPKEKEASYNRSFKDQKKTYAWFGEKGLLRINELDTYDGFLDMGNELLATFPNSRATLSFKPDTITVLKKH